MRDALGDEEAAANKLPAGLRPGRLGAMRPADVLSVLVPRGDAEGRAAGALQFHPRLQLEKIARLDRETLRVFEAPVFLASVFDARRALAGMNLLSIDGDAPRLRLAREERPPALEPRFKAAVGHGAGCGILLVRR